MKSPTPIIIVKKKGGHHGGHHGGAWKVAYADFVTAMMAFFLVMWLVTQSQEVRASVAGYFREPGVFDYEKSTGLLPGGRPGVEPGGAPTPVPPPDARALLQEQRVLAGAAEHIKQMLTESPSLARLADQIEFTVTAEGLKIELIERADSSFFDSGSAELRGESERILQIISGELTKLENEVVLEGHTDRRPYANDTRYGNWELSADRANAARRAMEHAGLNGGQVRGVRGFADTQLHLKDSPLDPRNRRVSIVVRSQAAAALDSAIRQGQELPAAPVPDTAGPAAAAPAPAKHD
ncbi:MAG TPA: flagellar motor protein MotB [Vicinamibacterales bacterium]|nr:flagellar motor protein MotB [Vicinamibacterales bacterium]